MGSSPAGQRCSARTVIVSRDRALGELLTQTLRSSGVEVAATATTVEALAALDGPVQLVVLDEHAAAAVVDGRARLPAASTIVFGLTAVPAEEISDLLRRFDAYVAADRPRLLAWLVTRVVHSQYQPVRQPEGSA